MSAGARRSIVVADRIGALVAAAASPASPVPPAVAAPSSGSSSEHALTVTAVFARSFHLGHGRTLVAVGGADLGNGPLNVLCRTVPMGGWRTVGVTEHARCTLDATSIAVDGGPVIDLASASIWTPAPWPASWHAASLGQALARLRSAAARHLPADGLSREVLGTAAVDGARVDGLAAALDRIARAPLAELVAWLADPDGRPDALQNAVAGLLGLGPGLTPSGDDVLAGAMVALHALGRAARAHAIRDAIADRAERATTPASLAFLAAAADGHATESLHAMVLALLRGDDARDFAAALGAVARVGHTSGFDMLAGAALVLDAAARGALVT